MIGRGTFGPRTVSVHLAATPHGDIGAMRIQLALLFSLAAYLVAATTFAGALAGVVPGGP